MVAEFLHDYIQLNPRTSSHSRSFCHLHMTKDYYNYYFFPLARYKIQETLFSVDCQIYNRITLAIGYFVDKHDLKYSVSIHDINKHHSYLGDITARTYKNKLLRLFDFVGTGKLKRSYFTVYLEEIGDEIRKGWAE